MRSVGLTGSLAAGKSAVADVWRAEGVAVISADELARRVVAPGSEGLREVVEAFGSGVLRDDGSLDRDVLRERVFGDSSERRRLERILHPRIGRLREEWIRDREAEGAALVASEIPLLFETGLEDRFDEIVVVDASPEERLRRLVEVRGLDPEEAGRMMASQMDPAEKRRRADHVIVNDGTLGDLRVEARAVLERIRAGEGG